jgi:hypothetical protein
VDVCKPATSKANNSETYLVALGFRGISKETLDTLLGHVGKDIYAEVAMLPSAALPSTFFQSVVDCGKYFARRTQAAIENALSKQSVGVAANKALNAIQDECAEEWIRKFKIMDLPRDLRLAPVRSHCDLCREKPPIMNCFEACTTALDGFLSFLSA